MNDPTPASQADTMPGVQHPEWSDETVAKFWDYWAARGFPEEEYFSQQVGEGLLNLARWHGCLRGDVLDYGCAQGHLTAKLLDEDALVSALDFSQTATANLNERFADRSNWRGATAVESLPSRLPDAAFDLIYCVEVVEHLLPAWQESTLTELVRLVRPNGRIIVTTPLAEDLAQQHVFCPFCSSTFHHMQHVRSITADDLRGWLSDAGLDVEFCQGVDLQNFQVLRPGRPRRLWASSLAKWLLRLDLPAALDGRSSSPGPNRRFRRAASHRGPHLVAIAAPRSS